MSLDICIISILKSLSYALAVLQFLGLTVVEYTGFFWRCIVLSVNIYVSAQVSRRLKLG